MKLKDTGTPQKQLAIGHEELKLPIQPERVLKFEDNLFLISNYIANTCMSFM
jgi:hypothetical protein